MRVSSCEYPNACDCLDCEEINLGIKEDKVKDQYGNLIRRTKRDYTPTLDNYHYQEPNIIPQKGDYMVATLQHYVAIRESKMFELNMSLPHDAIGVMYIGEHGLSQCTWGSPAQEKGRAIHSTSPGHWKLGLTPVETKEYNHPGQIQSKHKRKRTFCTVKD